jgi:hypothetical protein
MLRLIVLLAGLVLIGAGAEQVPAARLPRLKMTAHGTNFFSNCRLSHSRADDPIVHPRMPGGSHPHEFFGNTSTSAASTLATLLAHGTTCNRHADRAAYWVPALYQRGHVVKPLGVSVYSQLRSIGRIRPFPPGLKIVAGNAAAVKPQSTKIAFWNCVYPPGPFTPSAAPPLCPRRRAAMLRRGIEPRGHLLLNVNFPDCWDGRRLDSADHHSHMAYSKDLRCPASHPVKVPRLRLTVIHAIRGGRDLALASGGVLSAHADFFNAWNEKELKRLVERCAAELKRCSRPSGGSSARANAAGRASHRSAGR